MSCPKSPTSPQVPPSAQKALEQAKRQLQWSAEKGKKGEDKGRTTVATPPTAAPPRPATLSPEEVLYQLGYGASSIDYSTIVDTPAKHRALHLRHVAKQEEASRELPCTRSTPHRVPASTSNASPVPPSPVPLHTFFGTSRNTRPSTPLRSAEQSPGSEYTFENTPSPVQWHRKSGTRVFKVPVSPAPTSAR